MGSVCNCEKHASDAELGRALNWKAAAFENLDHLMVVRDHFGLELTQVLSSADCRKMLQQQHPIPLP